jgi:6-phosphogluconolactonase
MLTALMTLAGAAQAATFVYVSNAEDGDIGTYTLLPDGNLLPGVRVGAGKPVMPMSVSPDRRFLYAAVRSKPFAVITYAIDRKTGELHKRSGAALAESLPYIAVDKTGSFLLGASYGGARPAFGASPFTRRPAWTSCSSSWRPRRCPTTR